VGHFVPTCKPIDDALYLGSHTGSICQPAHTQYYFLGTMEEAVTWPINKLFAFVVVDKQLKDHFTAWLCQTWTEVLTWHCSHTCSYITACGTHSIHLSRAQVTRFVWKNIATQFISSSEYFCILLTIKTMLIACSTDFNNKELGTSIDMQLCIDIGGGHIGFPIAPLFNSSMKHDILPVFVVQTFVRCINLHYNANFQY
jgi:hypothetical protein